VFADPVIADKVIQQQHTIDRREVEAKRALPKEESPVSKDQQAAATGQRTKKIFVGGLAPTVDEATFRTYFEEYGTVEDAVVMYDHENKRPRGFGFITFTEEEAVDKVFAQGNMQAIHEKQIEVKRAVPRDSMPPSPRVMYRTPPSGAYYDMRSPYGGRPPPGFREGRGYASPFAPRGRGELGRSPVGTGRGLYTPPPPAIVTGIPAAMAAPAPAAATASPGGGAAEVAPPLSPSIGIPGNGSVGMQTPMAGMPSQAMQTPPHMMGGYTLQNGMQAAANQLSTVGSPPFRIEPQTGVAGQNLAELQQQVALNSVSEALEQLQVHQAQAQQAQQAQQQSQQGGQQPQSTIWS
jgi:hypothetical protein